MDSKETFARESQFHDDWACNTPINEIRVEAAFFAPTALENRFILKHLGSLQGRRLLDIGCGLGETSVMFAKQGALVTATDISPQMVETTRSLADLHGVKLQTAVGPAEEVNLPEGYFDVIFTANTIHHLADRGLFLFKISKLLKPDGVFCSWDPVKYNPVINFYRRMATEVRSIDEAPLGVNNLCELKTYFAEVKTRHFWLLSLALFLKYYFFDRISPNAERYWKKIYNETGATLWWWHPLRLIDELLLRIPVIKWLSWNIVVIARQPRSHGHIASTPPNSMWSRLGQLVK